jgi:prepilin-type N-terminal cleavage/methylation domain-containing protein
MKWAQKQSGFTIVELLIVVVVIAILAAITIVSYNGIQARANLSALQSDMRGIVNKVEMYKAQNGTYPQNNDVTMATVGLSASKGLYDTTDGNFLYCGSASTSNFAMVVVARNGTLYAIGSNRAFSTYTSFAIGNYASICNDLIGSNAPRYGYTVSDGWRWIAG